MKISKCAALAINAAAEKSLAWRAPKHPIALKALFHAHSLLLSKRGIAEGDTLTLTQIYTLTASLKTLKREALENYEYAQALHYLHSSHVRSRCSRDFEVEWIYNPATNEYTPHIKPLPQV